MWRSSEAPFLSYQLDSWNGPEQSRARRFCAAQRTFDGLEILSYDWLKESRQVTRNSISGPIRALKFETCPEWDSVQGLWVSPNFRLCVGVQTRLSFGFPPGLSLQGNGLFGRNGASGTRSAVAWVVVDNPAGKVMKNRTGSAFPIVPFFRHS